MDLLNSHLDSFTPNLQYPEQYYSLLKEFDLCPSPSRVKYIYSWWSNTKILTYTLQETWNSRNLYFPISQRGKGRG